MFWDYRFYQSERHFKTTDQSDSGVPQSSISGRWLLPPETGRFIHYSPHRFYQSEHPFKTIDQRDNGVPPTHGVPHIPLRLEL